MPFFLRFKLVAFCNGHDVWPLVGFQPPAQLHIFFHPTPPGVQQQDRQTQRLAAEQIVFNQPFPSPRDFRGDFRESISWQVYEAVTAVDLIEIDQLRTDWPGAGGCGALWTSIAVHPPSFIG